MINISTSKQLDIILPNTNKALAHVLKDATPKELEIITQGKDLKSIMNTILKQSGNSATSDKELLNLVKNNPTLKSLGDVSSTIKDLLNSIKSDKNPLPIEKTLKNFLIDIKDLNNSELKQKLENSGVFLESRLKNAKTPLQELRATLTSLAKTLQTSESPSTRAIANQALEVLKSDTLKTASSLNKLSSDVQAIISKLKTSLRSADTIHNPALTKALDKLTHQVEPKLLTPENFKLSSIKEPLEQISLIMNKSFTMETKSILGALEKIFQALKTIEQTTTTPKTSLEQFLNAKVPEDINKLSQSINSVIQKADPVFSKDIGLLFNKLQTLNSADKLNPQNTVKDIIANDLKSILLQAGDEIAKSSHPNQSELLKHMDKLSLQIDHYQLLSHLSNGSSLYLPFSWDMLQEGNIELKKAENDKFYCDIDLKLKEYGELNLKLTLYEKNQLNLHIYSSNSEFKEIIKENLSSLRSALINEQITPREIRIFEPKKQPPPSPYESQHDNLNMGFEVKG